MASRGRGVLLRLTGDSSDARRAVASVRSDLRRMSREEAKARVEIDTASAERRLKTLREDLANWKRQAETQSSPKLDVKIEKAEAKIKLLEFRLARLGAKNVQIDVDLRRGSLERTAAGLGSVERGIGRVTTGFGDALRAIPIFGQVFATVLTGAINLASTLGGILGSLVTSGIETIASTFKSLSGLGGFAGAIGGVVASLVGIVAQFALIAALGGAVAIALNAVLGAVVALGAALVALVASLTAAIAGFGALAVAMGGILLPVVAVAIGLFTRFAAILKARQAQEQALAQATQAEKTAEEQRKTALEGVRQAHERLAEAVVEGRRAMTNAANEERNAELALQNSQLGLKGARLGVLEAKKELRDLLATTGVAGKALDHLMKQFSDVHVDPTKLQNIFGAVTGAGGDKTKTDPLAVARAILNVQQAQQGVKNAVNDTTNAENRLAEATKQRAAFARRGLEAYKPYRTALEAVRRAELRLSRAQDASTAASRKYEQALKKLSPTEQGTLGRLNQLIAGFKSLAKAFTDPIFKALNETFDSLKGSGDGLKSALTLVGQAFGDFVRSIGAFLREPRTQQAFGIMAKGAADLTRSLGSSALVNGLRILREIAISALPALRDMARDVARSMANIAGQPGRIHRATSFVVAQFRDWLRLAGSVLGLVKDIFFPAATAGASLADSMRRVVDRWREWVRANPEKVRDFFRNMVIRARQILKAIKDVVTWLKDDLPKAADAAKKAFEDLKGPVGAVVDLINEFFNKLSGSPIEKLIFPFAPRGSDQGIRPPDGSRRIPPDRPGGLEFTPPSSKRVEDVLGEALRGLGKKGKQPRLAPNEPRAGTASAGGDVHFHITSPPGTQPDPRTTVARIRDLLAVGS